MLSSPLSQAFLFRPSQDFAYFLIGLLPLVALLSISSLAFDIVTRNQVLFLLLYIAAFVSAFSGGMKAGAWSIADSLLFVFFLILMTDRLEESNIGLRIAIFVLASGLTVYVVHILKNAYIISLSILNSVHTFTAMLRLDGTIIDINDSFLNRFGVAREEVVGASIIDGLPWQYTAVLKNRFRRAIALAKRGQRHRFDVKIVAKDNDVAYLDFSIAPIINKQHASIYLVASATEITSRVAAEQKAVKLNMILEQRIEELRTLFDVMPIGIGIAQDPHGKDIRVNAAFANLLKLPQQNNLSLSSTTDRYDDFTVFKNGVVQEREDLPMQIAARERRVISGEEYTVKLKDGSELKLLEYAAPLVDRKSRVRGAVGVFVDITERKKVEQALARSEKRFKRLVDSNLIGVVVASLDGRLLDANDAYANLIGYSQAEIRSGKVKWSDITPAEFAAVDQKAVAELKKNGQAQPFEKEFIAKDGTQIPVLIGVAMLEGSQTVTVGFVVDISARKKLERRKDEFIGLASHELKTPLTSIKVFTQLLERSLAQQENKTNLGYVLKMNHQIKRLTTLVEDLLDISKIESGKLLLHFEEFDLQKVVEDTVSDIQAITHDHHLSTAGRLTGVIEGDAYRLQQVLTNLLTNAIKYTPAGGDITVKLSETPQTVSVAVEDHGVGIPKDEQKKVFEKFFRARGKNRHSFPGLGLGLYISKQIIDRHNGTVQLESQEDKGSIFTVTVPKRRL